MTGEPTGYRTMLEEMVEELEGRPWPPPTRYTNILIALAVIEEMRAIADRLEDLNVNVCALGETIHDALGMHREDTVKVLRRIAADLPYAGKGEL